MVILTISLKVADGDTKKKLFSPPHSRRVKTKRQFALTLLPPGGI
jgi:hypothetical protein